MVGSPPSASRRFPCPAWARAHAARRAATTATSPVSGVGSTSAAHPRSRASSAAARARSTGPARSRWATPASRGSPGFGVSWRSPRAPASSRAATAAGSVAPRAATNRSASAKVVGSGANGPEAIVERSSPGTSERTRTRTGAGARSAAEPTSLQAREVLPERVQLADRRAGAHERRDRLDLLLERDPARRERPRGRCRRPRRGRAPAAPRSRSAQARIAAPAAAEPASGRGWAPWTTRTPAEVRPRRAPARRRARRGPARRARRARPPPSAARPFRARVAGPGPAGAARPRGPPGRAVRPGCAAARRARSTRSPPRRRSAFPSWLSPR